MCFSYGQLVFSFKTCVILDAVYICIYTTAGLTDGSTVGQMAGLILTREEVLGSNLLQIVLILSVCTCVTECLPVQQLNIREIETQKVAPAWTLRRPQTRLAVHSQRMRLFYLLPSKSIWTSQLSRWS